MTGSPFEREYAAAYDLLYADKPYAAECAYIEASLDRYSDAPGKAIVDLGCGTGGHARLLAERGFALAAVDRSAAMIELARSRTSPHMAIDWVVGDVRTVDLGRTFDAALLMFSVLGYQTTNADVQATFTNARRHLRRGGLLIFDVWYGPTVLANRPSDRHKVVADGERTLIRVSSSDLHADRDLVDVRMRTWIIERDRMTGLSEEEHAVRYFFIPELALFLDACGFEIATFTAFPDLDEAPQLGTWELGCIAVAR